MKSTRNGTGPTKRGYMKSVYLKLGPLKNPKAPDWVADYLMPKYLGRTISCPGMTLEEYEEVLSKGGLEKPTTPT